MHDQRNRGQALPLQAPIAAAQLPPGAEIERSGMSTILPHNQPISSRINIPRKFSPQQPRRSQTLGVSLNTRKRSDYGRQNPHPAPGLRQTSKRHSISQAMTPQNGSDKSVQKGPIRHHRQLGPMSRIQARSRHHHVIRTSNLLETEILVPVRREIR